MFLEVTIVFSMIVVLVIPGPATQLAKGYASLLKKTLRKGLIFCCLNVLDIGKSVLFWEDVSTLEKKVFFLDIFTEKG